ncbi:MAG: hypothetical protein HFF77_09035 [Oscillospiraceae bacterium]|jgi:hypothetical protein|nr:hypothetical protein [Oscillospiraceae bacterium]
MDTIVEELYHALCRTDTSTAHISDELWEKASAQAGEEAIAELRRLSREQLLDAELQGFRSGLLLGINMMSELL